MNALQPLNHTVDVVQSVFYFVVGITRWQFKLEYQSVKLV